MRILFFAESFGNTTFIKSQVEGLTEWHDVLFVCNYQYGASKVKVQQIPFEYPVWYNRIRLRLENHDLRLNLKHRMFGRLWREVVSTFDPEIKVLDNDFDPSRKYVIHFRGYDASKKLQLRTYIRKISKYLSEPNVFPVFVTDFLKKNLEKVGIKVRKEHLILHSATDLEFFKRKSEYPQDSSPFIFLQVSSFREKKGHIPTLRAFKLFLDRNPDLTTELWLTGASNDEFLKVKQEVERLGIQKFVIFQGLKTPVEIREMMEKCHVVLLHSITTKGGDTEGIPNALMEAMAMELPVVSTYHAGIPELVENEVNGILVQENDLEAYAKAMLDITKWGRIPINREKVNSYFSKDQHFKLINDFYKTISRKEDEKSEL